MLRFISRLRQVLGLGRRPEPPDSAVREPRRPYPPNRSGAVALELPRAEDDESR